MFLWKLNLQINHLVLLPNFSIFSHQYGGTNPIGLYRDVWIAAIASSRMRLATLSGVMCNTSQCELRSLRRKFGNVERNSHCDVLHFTPDRVANLVLDCNGVFAIKAYRPLSRRLDRCDRVIHNESGDPNGGNMCSFSGATCTSRVRHNADYVPYAKIRFDL